MLVEKIIVEHSFISDLKKSIFIIIGFICALQFLGSLFLSLYYFLKKENDKYLGFIFLIWLDINLLFLLVFVVYVLAESAVGTSGAITG